MTAYLEMFELTHTLQIGAGWAMWQRTSLPAEGGVEDQPSKLMDAITFIADQHNGLLEARRPKKAKRRRTKKSNV